MPISLVLKTLHACSLMQEHLLLRYTVKRTSIYIPKKYEESQNAGTLFVIHCRLRVPHHSCSLSLKCCHGVFDRPQSPFWNAWLQVYFLGYLYVNIWKNVRCQSRESSYSVSLVKNINVCYRRIVLIFYIFVKLFWPNFCWPDIKNVFASILWFLVQFNW